VKRAVFIDRDGVINRAVVRGGKPYPPASLDELEILPGVDTALTALHAAGYMIVVVTNQPDVATGVQRREVVESMHRSLQDRLAIDDIRTCYHADSDACDCRKPKPGMLLAAAQDHGIDLAHSYLVGDRWRDVAAGKAAGCYTFFIDYRYQERAAEAPDRIVASLAEATRHILGIDQSNFSTIGPAGS